MEIMVTIGIVAILAGIAVPSFTAMRQKARLRSTANRLVGDVKQARVLAGSGRKGLTGWPAESRVEMAGIRFISQTQYAIFADDDNVTNGSEVDLNVVDITNHGDPFHFLAYPPEIRFRRTGTLAAPADVDIVIEDTNGLDKRTVRVTYGGKVSIFL